MTLFSAVKTNTTLEGKYCPVPIFVDSYGSAFVQSEFLVTKCMDYDGDASALTRRVAAGLWTAGYTGKDLAGKDVLVPLAGIAAWCPLRLWSTDSFYGVNRSVDFRLAGLNLFSDADDPLAAIVDTTILLARDGGKPTHAFGRNLKNGTVEGACGQLQTCCDELAPPDQFAVLSLDSWTLGSLGGIPMNAYPDRAFFALYTSTPWANALVTLKR